MRPEKTHLTREYLARLNASPYLILIHYQGLKVGPLNELRRRLHQAGAALHVIKNTVFRLAARQAGLPDLGPTLRGQLALVTGGNDISAAAKTIKNFRAEFDRPHFILGYLGRQPLEAATLATLADLPSLDVLRGNLLGLLHTPATRLVTLLNTPASQFARVLHLHAGKKEELVKKKEE